MVEPSWCDINVNNEQGFHSSTVCVSLTCDAGDFEKHHCNVRHGCTHPHIYRSTSPCVQGSAAFLGPSLASQAFGDLYSAHSQGCKNPLHWLLRRLWSGEPKWLFMTSMSNTQWTCQCPQNIYFDFLTIIINGEKLTDIIINPVLNPSWSLNVMEWLCYLQL